MKRFQSSKYVLFALFTALLLTGGAVAQECDIPNATLKAQLYDDALTNYTDLLKQNPNLTCAQDGILAVKREQAINSYEKGRAYENASQVEKAKEEYVKALDNNSSFGDAQKALARLNDGIFTLAYTLYKIIRPTLEIIVVIVIFFLVLYALIYQIWPRILGFFRLSLDIGDFDKGATELEIGKGLGAMVQESYIRLSHEGRKRVNLVEGSPDKFQIPADVNVGPYFKLVYELINWLFPPNVITLSGCLQKPGSSLGSGITVALVKNETKKILASCTIWQNEFDLETTPKKEESIDPTSYYNLAELIAVWVHFQLGKLSKKREFTMMGTNDWKSYAYFKSGVRWYIEEKSEKAQQLFVESLGSDMKNWGTLFNLGRMEMEEGQYQHAFERLKMAKEKSISDETYKPEKFRDFPRNPIWYLASYSLALTYCYLNKRYNRNLTKIKNETKKLIETIDKSDDAMQKKDEKARECNLSMFEDGTKTLLELIQKASDDLQTAVYLSKYKPEEEKNQLDTIKNIAKKLLDTNREDILNIRKNNNNELKSKLSEVGRLADDIIKQQTNKSAPFNCIMSLAEKEANNLVNTIKKAIGPQLAEQEAKKLAGTIQEAIDAQQKNQEAKEQANKSVETISNLQLDQLLKERISKAIKQVDELVETIIILQQKNEDQVLKESLYEAKKQVDDLVKTIIILQQKNEDQVLKESLYEAKKQVDDLVKTIIILQQKNVVQVLKERLSKTKEQALELMETIILKAIWPKLKNDDKELIDFLELFYPMARIMQADTLLYVNFDEKIHVAMSIMQLIEPSSLTYRGRYNLACYYSIVGEKMYLFSWDEIPGNDNGRLINFLKQKYNIDWVKPPKIDKTDDITINVNDGQNYLVLSLTDEKTKVNLKIDDGRTDEFYRKDEKTKMEDAYRNSLCHLEYALERGGSIVKWATKDPDLNGVREDTETKEAFAKLIKQYGDQVEQDSADQPLAGLAIIGEAYDKQLKEQGIFSHCDLILKADTPQAQEELAKKLGISTRLMRRWVILADLMCIVGSTENANLLEAADVGSRDALKKVSNPCELTNLLNQINKAQSLVKTPLPIKTVEQWVQEANNLENYD